MFKKMNAPADMTVGAPWKSILAFTVPMLIGNIAQQLYSTVDSIVVGKYIGDNALAAVGNGYEITLIFIAFAFGCNIGCSVIVSQLFGAKKFSDMKTAVYTTLIAGGVLCAVLMTGGLLLCKTMLTWIHTPQSVFDDSYLYLLI